MTHLWVRAESRRNEDRVGITPDGVADLIAQGFTVTVEDSARRILPIDGYAAAGARIAPDRLILPHPRMQDRGFVLAPLAEIAPGWVHPRLGQSVAAMLEALGPEGLAGMAPEGGRAQV